jgi:WD40 repeat protein
MNCVGLIRQETKVIAGLGNGNMYIFDWKAFGYHSDAFGDHPSAINCMIPIMDNIVITGCDDGKIRAISLFPHRFLGVVGHHKFPIERLDISTCGHYIASTSHDGRVRFWNISYFEDPNLKLMESTTKKSVRNKKRSLRKEKLGFQLPSSKRRNKGDFFAGLAEPEPGPAEAAEPEAESDSDAASDSDAESASEAESEVSSDNDE